MARFAGFDALNIVAVYDLAAGGGVDSDPEAPKNAPAVDYINHLDKVHFHSDWFYYTKKFGPISVDVTHTALATKTTTIGVGASVFNVYGDVRERTLTLFTHSLGYVPRCFVSYNDAMLCSGTIVQNSVAGVRSVSVFADETIIGLKEITKSTNSALSEVSRNYLVLVFDTPAADPAKRLGSFNGSVLTLAREKAMSTHHYLRETLPLESSYDFDLGPTIGYGNGGRRTVTGGNVVTDNRYSGSFTGPDFIPVGV